MPAEKSRAMHREVAMRLSVFFRIFCSNRLGKKNGNAVGCPHGYGAENEDDRSGVRQGGISRFSQKIADPQTVNQVIGHVQEHGGDQGKRHGEQAVSGIPVYKIKCSFHNYCPFFGSNE